MLLLFSILLPLMMCKGLSSTVEKRIPRIGIIGGGVGGTSCAFFLKSLFGENNVSIDLYEAEKVGGRLSLANFSLNFYEEGGSIIHSRNKYMVEFLDKFGLKKRQTADGYFGLYDGHNFVFSESDWQIRTLWRVIDRYGFGFWALRNYIDDMLKKFERIYELQNNGMSYNTVGSMLAAMDPNFVNFLHTSTKSAFEKQGIPDIVVNEIIMATIRANYGQNLNVHKMVGSVSVAGAIGNLWSVEGGNVKIPEHLLEASNANLINLAVASVRKVPSGLFEIITKPKADGSQPEKDEEKRSIYDTVIIATPQTSDSKFKIEFQNFNKNLKFEGKYHRTVCTLVEGALSDKYFPDKSSIVDEILTTKESVMFNSIGRITPVDYTPSKYKKSNVWKVFTQNVMEDSQIDELFSNIKNKYVKEWLAYPHYGHSNRNDSFVLAPNLYHINAIEWAASAMEMSVIGAKNVALLAYNSLISDEGRPVELKTNSGPILHKKEL